ncbi:MAG TPA: type I 3-dehydroquinate dehydratase [Bacilli bacterium]|nr:type I 3-dehydroquinate dehydratase [Bacilli bacterium]
MLKIRNITIGEGRPKICLPITGKNIAEIKQQSQLINDKQADLVEWRVDFYQGHEIVPVLEVIREQIGDRPLIFTFRTINEGGEREITDQEYLLFNEKAMMSGLIDLVDIELKLPVVIRNPLIAKAKQQGIATIISNHDFGKTPAQEEMINRLKEAELIGASIAKLAVMPNNSTDVLSLLSVTNKLKDIIKIPLVTMSMGGFGVMTRLAGEIFGSSMTFGTVGQASAPGQIDHETLSTVLDVIHENVTK